MESFEFKQAPQEFLCSASPTGKLRCQAVQSRQMVEHCRGDHDSSSRGSDVETRDPLVGVFTLRVQALNDVPSVINYGNIQFHSDGALHGLDTGGTGGAGLGPATISTPWTGEWRKIGSRTYQIFFISTLSQIEDSAPYPNAGRFSVVADLTLSDDGRTISLTNAEANFYENEDECLESPFPLGIGNATGCRVDFSIFQR